jgi:hypothetical protein
MRVGSSVNVSVGRVVFAGSSNSVLNLSRTLYSSSVEEFNSVVIQKSGGAKVILESGNLFQNNNTTNSADTLVFVSGIIETGDNHWAILRTSSGAIVGASDSSYVNGYIGRGISNGGTVGSFDFPVGDSANYRPISLRVVAPSNATGHYVWAKLQTGDANSGSSVLNGGIDKVSKVRYYELGYLQNAGSSATMGFYGFGPSYGDDDGVTAGNSDLRVAYSVDTMATWENAGPVTDTTDLTSPPTTILSDSLATMTVNTGTSVLVALARATGTTTNTLEQEPNSVEKTSDALPAGFALRQNYPNPFNPSTTIRFEVRQKGFVAVTVHDILGREVAALVNEELGAGTYKVEWNAALQPSGVYFYSIEAAGFKETRKMILMK